MNANQVPGVGKIDNEAPRPVRPLEPSQGGVEPRGKPAQVASTKPPEVKVEAPPRPDVQLRFIVDPQSKEVTVLLLDRATQEIVRTIPPGELSNLKEGDLLSLFA